jgi:undecaprenyl-diphosphatase
MEIIHAVILALVQGVTECAAHLQHRPPLIAQSLMGVAVPISFDMVLHIGTVAAVAAAFWRDIAGIISAVIRFRREDPLFRIGMLVILGSLPTAAIGYLVSMAEESLLSLPSVGCALLLTSALLFISRYGRGAGGVGTKHALLVGTVQGIAVIPGLSRSGSTISAALLAGVGKAEAFRFSIAPLDPRYIGRHPAKAGRDCAVRDRGRDAPLKWSSRRSRHLSIRALRKVLLSGRLSSSASTALAAGIAVLAYSLI